MLRKRKAAKRRMGMVGRLMAPLFMFVCLSLPSAPSHGASQANKLIDALNDAIAMQDLLTIEKLIPKHGPIAKKVFGADDLEYASSLDIYCQVKVVLFRLEDAKKICAQAYQLSEKGGDKTWRLHAGNSRSIGHIFLVQGQDKEAEKWFQQSVNVVSKFKGQNTSEMAENLEKIANSYFECRQYQRALQFYQMASKIQQSTENTEPSVLVNNVVDQIEALVELGHTKEATSLLNKITPSAKKTFKPDSTDMLDFEITYAKILRLNGDLDNAEKLARSIVSRSGKDKYQWRSLSTAAIILGDILVDKKAYEDANKQYRQSLTLNAKYSGRNHPSQRDALDGLERLFKETGNTKEAEKIGKWRAALPY